MEFSLWRCPIRANQQAYIQKKTETEQPHRASSHREEFLRLPECSPMQGGVNTLQNTRAKTGRPPTAASTGMPTHGHGEPRTEKNTTRPNGHGEPRREKNGESIIGSIMPRIKRNTLSRRGSGKPRTYVEQSKEIKKGLSGKYMRGRSFSRSVTSLRTPRSAC